MLTVAPSGSGERDQTEIERNLREELKAAGRQGIQYGGGPWSPLGAVWSVCSQNTSKFRTDLAQIFRIVRQRYKERLVIHNPSGSRILG